MIIGAMEKLYAWNKIYILGEKMRKKFYVGYRRNFFFVSF